VNGGAPAVGRSAISEVAQSFMTTFPDLKLTLDGLVVQRGQAVYGWTLESRGRFDNADYQRQLAHDVEGEASH